MHNSEVLENSISTKDLYKQYSWYKESFAPVIQEASNDFFSENFRLEFVGLSKNINCMLNNETCFVTKIKIAKEYDMFFRLTSNAIDIILNKTLGKPKNKFDLNKISELEAKIITSFNGYLFNAINSLIGEPNPKELKRENYNTINLTFILKDVDTEQKQTGKIIIALPEELLSPEMIESTSDKFSNTDFPNSLVPVKIIAGSTRFPLYEIKNLEIDDVVVFDNSNIEKLKLIINDEVMDVNINPNMGLLISQTGNIEGEKGMADANKNIWDSIEVDMNAEFESVKITLGELKNIEDGLVVDLASLYNNNVVLKVEGKPIAKGSLVIVNDRYGVKITEVVAKSASPKLQQNESSFEDENSEQEYEENNEYNDNTEYSEEEEYEQSSSNQEQEEEDFDYSDFELEDEDNI